MIDDAQKVFATRLGDAAAERRKRAFRAYLPRRPLTRTTWSGHPLPD